jgi:hypothetical protein
MPADLACLAQRLLALATTRQGARLFGEVLGEGVLAKEVRAASSRRHAEPFAGRPKRSQLALSGNGRTKIPARPR